MGSFDELPIDLLQLIAGKIADHADILRFGAVSRKFHSIVMDNLHLLPLTKFPLCLCVLPCKSSPLPLLMQCHYSKWENINFFSISDERNHGEFLVPEMRNKWIAGSSHGWLCTVDIQGRDVQLLNPVTRAQIPLPSLDAFPYPKCNLANDLDDFGFLEKVVISSDPSNKRRSLDDNGGILAMALVSNFSVLSFCKVGDDKWTNVEDCLIHIKDVICYKGQIYGVNYEGKTVVYDFAGEKKMKQIANSLDSWRNTDYRYLVESKYGDLLQVARVVHYYGDDGDYDECILDGDYDECILDGEGICTTTEFVVYKLEAVDEPIEPKPSYYFTIDGRVIIRDKFKFKWVEMESLDDQALFLGKNYSHCVRATEYEGCKPNCIYFTEHGLLGHRAMAQGYADDIDKDSVCDMGIYDLGEKKFQRFSQLNIKYLAPPIWISPNPW